MLKRNKELLIVTSVLILLPMLIGLLLWSKLPEELPIHWNANGEADGWSGKAFTVFAVPAILLGLQWLGVLATVTDPKHKVQSRKTIRLVLWIVPVISMMLGFFVYGAALGVDFKMKLVAPLLVGVLYVVVGNYLPKCKQSYTIGIKLPWTLDNEENWSRTHRMAGKLWVAGGFVTILSAFTPVVHIIFVVVLLIMVLAPTLYSYALYRKQNKKQGTA